MIKILLGLDRMPGWFAISGLVAMHAIAFPAITKVLVPWMKDNGISGSLALLLESMLHGSGNYPNDDQQALWAVASSFAMHLFTFYPYFLLISMTDGLDNANPRDRGRMISSSFRGRLLAAHQNQLESFPGFAAAVLTAVFLKKSAAVVPLAWLHVICRQLYWVFYALNIPNLRSMVFVTGFDCVALIFLEALQL